MGGVPPDPDDDNFQTMTAGGKYVHKVDNDIFSDEFWVTFIKCRNKEEIGHSVNIGYWMFMLPRLQHLLRSLMAELINFYQIYCHHS